MATHRNHYGIASRSSRPTDSNVLRSKHGRFSDIVQIQEQPGHSGFSQRFGFGLCVCILIESGTFQCQNKSQRERKTHGQATTCLKISISLWPVKEKAHSEMIKLTDMCDHITWHLCSFPPKPWANSFSTPARLTSQLVPCQCQRQHVDRSRTWRHQCMTCK